MAVLASLLLVGSFGLASLTLGKLAVLCVGPIGHLPALDAKVLVLVRQLPGLLLCV